MPFAVCSAPDLHRYDMVMFHEFFGLTYRGMASDCGCDLLRRLRLICSLTYRSVESLQLAVTIAAAILCSALGWLDIQHFSVVRACTDWRTRSELRDGAGTNILPILAILAVITLTWRICGRH